MNDNEFKEWLKGFKLLDAAQAEEMFFHLCHEYIDRRNELDNMDALSVALHCREAAKLIQARTGD